MNELMITCPLRVDVKRGRGKPKRCYLSLNCYRNWHHRLSNDAKHEVKRLVWDQLDAMDGAMVLRTPIEVRITLYAPDKRERDLGNFCAMAQKFVDDAVVEYGLLTDDSVKYIKRVVYEWGGLDRCDPRFEIKYRSI